MAGGRWSLGVEGGDGGGGGGEGALQGAALYIRQGTEARQRSYSGRLRGSDLSVPRYTPWLLLLINRWRYGSRGVAS